MPKNYGIIGVSLAVVAGFMITACATHKDDDGLPVPTAKMAQKAGKPLDTLGKGYSLSQVHCAQCHEFKMPEDMRVAEWHTIVPGMAWNAGLEKEDEDAVMAYLVAATEQIRDTGE